MTERVQILGFIVSVILLAVVLELVRRRKLAEEYSFLWILGALALLALSLWREGLHAAARWLGVHYPPAVLLLLLIVMVFVASLSFSVIVSRQRRQIDRLVEDVAILDAELRDVPRSTGDRTDGDNIERSRSG
jgi:hypothetical protein